MRVSGWIITVLATGCLGTLGPDVHAQAQALSRTDFEQSLTAMATLALVAVSAWTLGGITLTAVAVRVPALAAPARALTPALLRDALLLGAAGALAMGPVAAASAPPGHDTSDPSRPGHRLDGLRPPDRPVAAMPGRRRPPLPRPAAVIVRGGDSLWSIAARRLGPDAGNARINTAMHRWYATNRAEIGPDPDRILPGQHLRPPTKDSA